MGIYINGMEMPPSCYFCPMTNDGFYLCKANNPYRQLEDDCEECKPQWCPLVPVPPHGRLIDAEAYESLLRGLGDRNYRREKGTICDAIKFLHPYYAPTIIQASGKDADVHTREEEV